MSESSSQVIAAWPECFPDKLSWCQGGEDKISLSGPMDWILRYIKAYLFKGCSHL